MMKCLAVGLSLLMFRTAAVPQTSGRAASAAATTLVPNAVIVMNRFGIYPNSITMPAGQFLLVLHNRLPEQDETVQVALKGSEPSASTASITTSAGHAMAWQLLNLAPGSYVASFKNHPNFSVAITITD